jgi:hypothetical protein
VLAKFRDGALWNKRRSCTILRQPRSSPSWSVIYQPKNGPHTIKAANCRDRAERAISTDAQSLYQNSRLNEDLQHEAILAKRRSSNED